MGEKKEVGKGERERGEIEGDVFFFKQKTAYEIGQ